MEDNTYEKRSGKQAPRHAAARPVKRRSPLRWLLPLLIAVVLLAAAFFILNSRFVLTGGQLLHRDAETADLRGKDLTPESFEKLSAQLPGCRILWDVPFGGGKTDCTSETVTVSAFDAAELDRLGYFTALREIDARSAALTAEDYAALSAAADGCRVLWSIPIGGARYDSSAETVTLSEFPAEDAERFSFFERLNTADATACTDLAAVMAARTAAPGTAFLWNVPIGGGIYGQDTQELTLSGSAVNGAELAEKLAYLPALQSVTLKDCSCSAEEMQTLRDRYENVFFLWEIELCGKTFASDEAEISFAGSRLTDADADAIAGAAKNFTNLSRIDMTDTGLSDAALMELCDKVGAVDVVWNTELYGVPVNTLDTFLDFTGIPMESTEEVEALVRCMHHLEKVDMSDCGFDDETMDALNKKYETVRFVWTLHITHYNIRTDATYFRGTCHNYGYFTDETVQRLQYCTDMICLDLGHRPVGDLSFLRCMPKLKYLILLDCEALDLSPISSLQNLIWLEMNRANTASLAPLKECMALRDLNITFVSGASQEDIFETLMDMPQLERVWWSRAQMTEEQEAALQEAHPDILYHVVYDWVQSNEDPWRYDQDYYDMRDILRVFYMNGTGRINCKIIDGVRYELPEDFAETHDSVDVLDHDSYN